MSDPLDPLVALREQFRLAAVREMTPRRRWWTRWRAFAAVLFVGAATAAVATGVDLLPVGKDLPDPIQERSQRYVPSSAGSRVVITIEDPDRELPWGVAIYTSPTGERCALAGQALGPELGLLEAGAFRRFEPNSGGACGDIANVRLFLDFRTLAGRTLLYGRARRDVAAIRLVEDGGPRRTETGPGGAFLFVLDGPLDPSQSSVVPLTADGREAPIGLESP